MKAHVLGAVCVLLTAGAAIGTAAQRVFRAPPPATAQARFVSLHVGLPAANLQVRPADTLRRTDTVAVGTSWVVGANTAAARVQWIAPNSAVTVRPLSVEPDWTQTRVSLPPPLAVGSWRVRLLDGDDVLAEQAFQVRPTAARPAPAR